LKSIPVQAPLYPEPPYYYEGAHGVFFVYDTEKENIKKVLPEFFDVGDMPLVALAVLEYPKTTIGPYNEAYALVQAKCGDVSGWFNPFMWVNTDDALAAGREIWGFPKKIADIKVLKEEEQVKGVVERRGVKIIDTVVEPASPLEMPLEGSVLTFKQMFKADGSGEEVRRVVLTNVDFKPTEMMSGKGVIKFGKSKDDPIHILKPKQLAASISLTMNLTLPYGKIVKTIV
jgi:acetoacetate decarboxylase